MYSRKLLYWKELRENIAIRNVFWWWWEENKWIKGIRKLRTDCKSTIDKRFKLSLLWITIRYLAIGDKVINMPFDTALSTVFKAGLFQGWNCRQVCDLYQLWVTCDLISRWVGILPSDVWCEDHLKTKGRAHYRWARVARN